MIKKGQVTSETISAVLLVILLAVILVVFVTFLTNPMWMTEIKAIAKEIVNVEEDKAEIEIREVDALFAFNAVVKDLENLAQQDEKDCVGTLKTVPYFKDHYILLLNKKEGNKLSVGAWLYDSSNKVVASKEIEGINLDFITGVYGSQPPKNPLQVSADYFFNNYGVKFAKYGQYRLFYDGLDLKVDIFNINPWKDAVLLPHVPIFYLSEKGKVHFLTNKFTFGSSSYSELPFDRCWDEDYEDVNTKKDGKKLIVIDPAGEAKVLQGVDLQERLVTWDIANKVKEIFDQLIFEDYEVILTHKRGEVLSRTERAKIANDANADLLVSIALDNLLEDTDVCSQRGMSAVVYCSCTNSPCEISDSCIDSSYDSEKWKKSKKFANILGDILFKPYRKTMIGMKVGGGLSTLGTNRDWVWRGVRGGNYIILEQSEIPAIIFNAGYICNEDDGAILKSGEGKTMLAGGIAETIIEYFSDEGGSFSFDYDNEPANNAKSKDCLAVTSCESYSENKKDRLDYDKLCNEDPCEVGPCFVKATYLGSSISSFDCISCTKISNCRSYTSQTACLSNPCGITEKCEWYPFGNGNCQPLGTNLVAIK